MRCGCNNVCNCAIQACDDTTGLPVTIKGNGQPATPYRICVSPPAIQVTDSNTVDLALSGTGSQADPYDITAGVIINPAPANGQAELLREEAGGLTLTCEDVAGCGPFPVVAGPCGITGDGTAAAPLAANVAAWPFACDQAANAQGVFCDPASGQLQAPPRTGYVGSAGFTLTQGFPPPGVTPPDVESLDQSLTVNLPNPSCYNMATIKSTRGHHTFMGTGHAQASIAPDCTLGPGSDLIFDYNPAGVNATNELGVQGLITSPGVIVGPGGVAGNTVCTAIRRVGGTVGITFRQITLDVFGWTTI